MSNLDPVADEAVRVAVEAFVAGAFVPMFRGETIFETKNSRYRLLDGVVIAAPDPSLVGVELVGWLLEGPGGAVVETAWRSGARAVLVDRRRARNIVVTSTTSLRNETSGPRSPSLGGHTPRPAEARPSHPSQPRAAAYPRAPAPVGPQAAPHPGPQARAHAGPFHGAALSGPAPRSPEEPSYAPLLPPPPRPLPPPQAPPRQIAPPPAPPSDEGIVSSTALPLVTRVSRPEAPPAEMRQSDPPWEVTSAEMEIAVDAEGAPVGHKEEHDTLEDIEVDPPDSNGTPFLLTRQTPAPPEVSPEPFRRR